METMHAILAVLAGILIRLIVPLIVTGFVVYLLRRLDAGWQLEAEKERGQLLRNELPCWIEQGLSVEDSKQRAALSDQPCWQVHRSSNGYLREDCLECEVFLDAPLRNPKHSHAHI